MGTKNNPGRYDCYANADPDEPLFTLVGHDRHGAALVELWALLREKEGEDPENVADAREDARAMARHAYAMGKPVMTLDALLSFAASVREPKEPPNEGKHTPTSELQQHSFRVGDLAVANRGIAGRIEAIFDGQGPLPEGVEPAHARLHEQLRAQPRVNLRYPRLTGPISVFLEQLRPPTDDEREAYRKSGGQ